MRRGEEVRIREAAAAALIGEARGFAEIVCNSPLATERPTQVTHDVVLANAIASTLSSAGLSLAELRAVRRAVDEEIEMREILMLGNRTAGRVA